MNNVLTLERFRNETIEKTVGDFHIPAMVPYTEDHVVIHKTIWNSNLKPEWFKLHHLGFLRCEVIDELRFLNHPNTVTQQNLIAQAEEIWENEVEPKEDLLANAIKECKEIDEKAGRRAIL